VENSVYGFTCNTQKEPLRPVLQVQKSASFDENADVTEYPATVEKASSYNENDSSFTYYIVKAEATLDIGAEYSYRIYDKYVEIGSTPATIKARDVKSEKFTFTHVADTQDYPTEFGYVLKSVTNTTDFLLHTGDVVESSKHEHHWKAMLNGNFANLSKTPMMAISGNHETTYKHGSNETFKHFHYKLPTQNSTLLGFFYSFSYGNAKFIMLNTNVLTGNRLTNEQYDWLVNELKTNDKTWTIVAMHNPVYSAGRYGSESTRNEIALALQPQLQGIFAQYGVDIVLQGHDHVVSSTHPLNGEGQAQTETKQTVEGVEYSVNPQGVYYLMTGTSGGQTRSPYTTNSALYKYALASKASSFTNFEIDGNSMKISVSYYQSGEVKTYQTWGIQKTAV
jgi:3',5'-cyclic AMP phosphodiesterase CpdA